MRSIRGASLSSALALSLLAGCATTAPPAEPAQLEPEVVVKTKIVDNSCRWFKPVILTPSDVLADSSARQIAANNETGAARCGWKPPSPSK